MPVAGIVLVCSLPIPILAGLYWHWRVYSLYKRLGDRVKNISYYWFCFQFQNPSFAKQLPGYSGFLDHLPDDLSTHVVTVRRQIRCATAALAIWMILAVILFGVSGL
jgi:hypothetical protein